MNIPTTDSTMSSQEFYTLLALTDKTLHGYGVREQVAYDSGSSVVMATGTVYGLLKRLTREGLVRRVRGDEGPRGIVYRYALTGFGEKCLKDEVKRLEYVTRHARYKFSVQR